MLKRKLKRITCYRLAQEYVRLLPILAMPKKMKTNVFFSLAWFVAKILAAHENSPIPLTDAYQMIGNMQVHESLTKQKK
jgi:hypothetical protein